MSAVAGKPAVSRLKPANQRQGITVTPFSNSRFACLCLLLLGAAESTSAAPLDPEQLKAIDSTVETAVLAKSLPGAALAIVVDGKVVAARTYGSRDVEAKAPVTKATVFRLGSIFQVRDSGGNYAPS